MATEWCEYDTSENADGHPFNGKKGKVEVKRTVYDGDGLITADDKLIYCLVHAEIAHLMPGKDEVVNGHVIGELDG